MIKHYGEKDAISALHAMVQQLPLSCLVKDDELRYRVVNRMFCDLIAMKEADMVGKRAAEIFEGDFADEIEARERRVLESGAEAAFEETVVDPDGAARHFITHVKRITTDGGRHFVCVTLSDVTDLNRARRDAESADRVKSDFLATMSHELRTPMNGVLGLTQILKETPLNDDQRLLVDSIATSGEGLLSIISDILDVSVIEAGRLRLCPAPYDLEPLVEDVARMMTPAAEAAGLKLFLSAGPHAPWRGHGDAMRIRQVLTNFIGNAIKFTEIGHIEIRYDADPGGQTLSLTVTDSGAGVSVADQAVIFERFRQVGDGRRQPRQGVGLGLAICKALGALMGGDVTMTSTLGVGSSFTLTCAVNQTSPEDAAAAIATGDARAARRDVGRVRVVDGFAPRARALASRLDRWGWTPVEGGPGESAGRVAEHGPGRASECDADAPVDAVVAVMDAPPPGMNAAPICGPLPPGAPVVFIAPLGARDMRPALAALAADRDFEVVSAPGAGIDLRQALVRLTSRGEQTSWRTASRSV